VVLVVLLVRPQGRQVEMFVADGVAAGNALQRPDEGAHLGGRAGQHVDDDPRVDAEQLQRKVFQKLRRQRRLQKRQGRVQLQRHQLVVLVAQRLRQVQDRKSTRLNSSHVKISYAVFCLKKKKSHK